MATLPITKRSTTRCLGVYLNVLQQLSSSLSFRLQKPKGVWGRNIWNEKSCLTGLVRKAWPRHAVPRSIYAGAAGLRFDAQCGGRNATVWSTRVNRDAANNIDPDSFDIRREHSGHVSLGYGIHLCLSLALARLEAKVAIGRRVHWYVAWNIFLSRLPASGLVKDLNPTVKT